MSIDTKLKESRKGKGLTAGSMIGRGIVLLILGAILLIFTLAGMTFLGVLTGIFLMVFGLTLLFGCFETDGKAGRVVSIILGILVIIVGVFAIIKPVLFETVAIYLCAAIAIVAGIYELIIGITGGDEVYNRPLQIITGIVAILFGIAIFALPMLIGGLTVVWILGAFLAVYGILLLINGIIVAVRNKKGKAVSA